MIIRPIVASEHVTSHHGTLLGQSEYRAADRAAPRDLNPATRLPPSEITLSGLRTPAAPFDTQVQVDSALQLTADGSLAGTVNYVTSHRYDLGSPVPNIAVEGEIISASRVALEPSVTSFSGTWKGSYVVQSCTFVGWTHCWPGQDGHAYNLTLSLTQTGSTVVGSLSSLIGIPVTGSVSGDELISKR